MVDKTDERRSTDAVLLEMISKLQSEISTLTTSLNGYMGETDPETHKKQHEYLDLVIAREKEKAAMRRAIIEKTLSSLVWAAIVFTAAALWYTITGTKPPHG